MAKINGLEISKVGEYSFVAMPFHCDFANKLRIDHLGNYMLNAADFHSNDRGLGMNYLNTIDKTWVLSRFAIEIFDMPSSYTMFNVATWVESAMRFFTSRNFSVTSPEGHVWAYGRSIWAMIDTKSRQPVDILKVRDGLLNHYIDKEKLCGISPCSRVKVGEKAQLKDSVKAVYCDIDMNGHVNSVKYIEHVLNLWDLEWYKSHSVSRIEIAYVAEAHCGDVLNFYVDKVDDNFFSVRICTGIEICRCSVKFNSIG